jgi:hypothetical protein
VERFGFLEDFQLGPTDLVSGSEGKLKKRLCAHADKKLTVGIQILAAWSLLLILNFGDAHVPRLLLLC